jgi:hypothetical protein
MAALQGLTKAKFLRLLPRVRAVVDQEIRHEPRGHAGEGYRGGYRDALDDVDAVLRHGSPNDLRAFWSRALIAQEDRA